MKKEYLIPSINLYECKEAFCTDNLLSIFTDFGDNNWGDEMIPEEEN